MSLNAKAMLFLAATSADIKARAKKYEHTVPSPCMSVCQMDDETALCQGCLRTLDEIGRWGNADNASRRMIWQAIEARVARYSV
jgi:predicted Fe-S protein YdhL (DUF1289 family)